MRKLFKKIDLELFANKIFEKKYIATEYANKSLKLLKPQFHIIQLKKIINKNKILSFVKLQNFKILKIPKPKKKQLEADINFIDS